MCHVILHRDDATNIWRALDISTAVGGLSLSVKGVCVPSLTPTSTLSATLVLSTFRHWHTWVGSGVSESDDRKHTHKTLSLCCYSLLCLSSQSFFPKSSNRSSHCFAKKVAQYTDYMTKEYIAITNRCYTIPTKPSLKWLHNEPLSILPVPVCCPSSCLITGGNNSISWSCCTNACLPWPLSCLPHRLTQFIGSFIDYRQVFLSLCPPIFAFHTRKTILAMLTSTRLLTHCHKL